MAEPRENPENKDLVASLHGLSASRLEQLRRDLALTPEERVRAAEETLQLDKLRQPGGPRPVRSFDRYEDYLDYKFRASAGRD